VSDPGAVVSVLTLRVLPGSEPALIGFYAEQEVFEHARRSGGFRHGRLLAPREAGTPFLVIAEWDDAAAYERWLENPVREELGRGLAPLLAEEPARGQLYEQVGLWGDSSPGPRGPGRAQEGS